MNIPHYRNFSHYDYILSGILPVVIVVMLAVIASGCESEGNLTDGPHSVRGMRLCLSACDMPTRGSTGEEYGRRGGSADENHISADDLWGGAFDKDGVLIDIIYDNSHDTGLLLEPDADDSSDGTMRDISAEFDASSYKDGEVRVVALANWSRFLPDGVSFGAITDIKGLSEMCFEFSPEKLASADKEGITDYYPLPMYGERVFNLLDAGVSDKLQIGLERRMAKIEIIDNTDSGILSASLACYLGSGSVMPSGNFSEEGKDVKPEDEESRHSLCFNKSVITVDEVDRTCYYLYVPEMILGESVDDERRRITLTMCDGEGGDSGVTKDIYIAHHDETGLPTESTEDVWKRLKGNHIYRFVVKGDVAVEPEIEIQSTLRVIWYGTYNGRFYNNTATLFTYAFSQEESLVKPTKGNTSQMDFDYPLKEGLKIYCRYFDISLEGEVMERREKYHNLWYAIALHNLGTNNEGSRRFIDDYKHQLCEDVIKLENVEEKEKGKTITRTYCWLNSVSIVYLKYPFIDTFDPNCRYRIYWYDLGEQFRVVLGDDVENGEVVYDERRRYWHMDFKLTRGDLTKISYKIENGDREMVMSVSPEGSFEIDDVTTEMIDGVEYNVFYVN